MIDVLFSSYIGDEANENAELDFFGKFGAARTIAFVFMAHQGYGSPDTAGVKVAVEHRDAGDPGDHPYEPVPNAVLSFSSPAGVASSVVEIPPGTLKALGRIVLQGTGTGDPAGAGSVTAVW